jgi:hypothetical protein
VCVGFGKSAGSGDSGSKPKPSQDKRDSDGDHKKAAGGSGGDGDGDGQPGFNASSALPMAALGLFLLYMMMRPEVGKEEVSWQDVRNQYLAKGMVRAAACS